MNREEIIREIKKKSSCLCVGLDSDISKIPAHLKTHKDPVFEFNKAIIDATHEYCIAYKPNLAFYEHLGPSGLESLKKTIEYIPEGIFTIADAKRGDIGNTGRMYAETFFNFYGFDAITVAPYMGKDSLEPFLAHDQKWAILLALTSNQGSEDFQSLPLKNSDDRLFERVIKESSKWAGPDKLMYVVGATKSEYLKDIRKLIPGHFILVPGVGTQGGDLEEVIKYGANHDIGLIINASRSILFASADRDFYKSAKNESRILQEKMKKFMEKFL